MIQRSIYIKDHTMKEMSDKELNKQKELLLFECEKSTHAETCNSVFIVCIGLYLPPKENIHT